MTERRTRGTGPVLVRLSDSGLVLEDLTQDVRGLDVGAGGFLGLGERRFLIPVEAVSEVREDRVVVAHKRQKVAGSPLFDADVVVPQPPYQDELYEYYGYLPPLH